MIPTLFLLDILPFPTVAEIAFDFFSVTTERVTSEGGLSYSTKAVKSYWKNG